MPRQRYFPADAMVDRWLRSSPVEVGGAEIGRINARLLEDGRIEFAFTPTDGERIAPQARYFPAGARVGRWLRSTEITIGPAVARYSSISAGHDHTCAIRKSEEIACWGGDLGAPPDGSYTAVSAGWHHTCAIRTSGEIACWGINGYPTWDPETETTIFIQTGATDAPEGSYTAISAGGNHTCALRESGEIACWGDNGDGQTDAPPVRFTAISAGSLHTCAIRTNGEIACWGGINRYGETDAPEGSYTAISAAFDDHACALRARGAIACWGDNTQGQTDAPEGSYIAVSAGGGHTCAIRESGDLACWGWNEYGQTDAPEGSYTAVAAGSAHTCAIRENGAIECWGRNRYGQATPPTD